MSLAKVEVDDAVQFPGEHFLARHFDIRSTVSSRPICATASI